MSLLIKSNLDKIYSQIRHAEIAAGRPKNSVRLLAVSKTKPVQAIINAFQAGQRHFGESYLQEALDKQRQLGAYPIIWHFIGPIQSNKTRLIAENFNWVHSVDRFKIAQRLDQQRPEHLPPLNIFLQVNISDESTKSGFKLAELPEMIAQVECLPRLRLRGVMAIPSPAEDYQQQRQPYNALYNAVKALNKPALNQFSFGMSGDLKAAIAEGSTMVRIGTALFGEREYQ